MKVGFIGLGVMGRPMAENLLRAGHELFVWARRPEAVRALVDLGARAADSPAALARAVDAAFVCVTTGADVEAVALGSGGLIEGTHDGLVVIDHSTIAPGQARHLAARFAGRGAAYLDAPVSGGGAGARAATLAIMVGGEAAALARVRPLLEALGKTIVHIGASGAGQVAKLCNQMVMVAAIEASAEAARLAATHGIDFGVVRGAMMAGSAGSRVLEVFGGRMAARDFTAGVEARLHHKDFAIVLAAAAKAGAPLPIAAQVAQQLNSLMARGWGRDDSASLLRVLEAA
jgi:2-hydroxy-3-oxopropionate reductase